MLIQDRRVDGSVKISEQSYRFSFY